MLGDQTEMVVSQRRDVSHNHKEGRPAGRSRHAKRGPASCCWLPCLSSENALRPQPAAEFRLQSKKRPQMENKICGQDPKGSVLRPQLVLNF